MHGYEVLVANSVERGIDQLDSNPTVVILDLMLPDGDGMRILSHARARKLPAKVAVTTAIHDRARLAAVQTLHPTCVLRKPIDLDTLLRAIGVE